MRARDRVSICIRIRGGARNQISILASDVMIKGIVRVRVMVMVCVTVYVYLRVRVHMYAYVYVHVCV